MTPTGSPADPDDVLVELVDEDGTTTGTAPKLNAHQPPGTLHRAVSVFLLDDRGRLLLQRRAAAKYHSGGAWSNTCCSHPAPGETPPDTARRRVRDELGVEPTDLTEAGTVVYRLTDPRTGLVEHEYNHLFIGRGLGEPMPDPAEVDGWEFVRLEDLMALQRQRRFSVWFPVVLEAALPALHALAERSASG